MLAIAITKPNPYLHFFLGPVAYPDLLFLLCTRFVDDEVYTAR